MRSPPTERRLSLDDLQTSCPRLTPASGQFMADAAAVCLEEQGHGREVPLRVSGTFRGTYRLHRSEVTEQMRGSYDPDEATEFGACGVAILVIRDQTGHTVQRAFRGNGFDYWIGTVEAERPFQQMARLEVSGIRRGGPRLVRARLRQKLAQVRSSDVTLPAYAIVVEFSRPEARVEQV